MRKAYSYIRMSTEIQLKGDSLRRQLEASEAYARANNLELVDSIDGVPLKDIGVSAFKGKNTQKGVLAVFLDALDRNKIPKNSVLLIESLDRLSRDKLSGALTQFMDILNRGIEIVTLADNQRYTQEIINANPGALFISLGVMFRANEESEMKSKRLKAAWTNKRNNLSSKVLTSIAPAWMRLNQATQKFEIIEERAKIIRLIFDMCTDTCGLYGIARYLNERHVPMFGRGKLWHRSYIKKVISNRAAFGEFQPHTTIDGVRQKSGEPIKDYFPAVVDENTFHLANAAIERRTANSRGRKGENFSNIFSGLPYCGSCGFKMVLRNRGMTTKGGGKSLRCYNNLNGGGCKVGEWKMDDVENSLFRHFREINFDELMGNSEDRKLSLQGESEALQAKLKSKVESVDRATGLLISSELVEAAKNRMVSQINSLEAEIKELKQQIDAIEKQITEEAETRKAIGSSELKELIDKIQAHKDDYLFRSSVNQLLAKQIERIEFLEEAIEFMPWEYDEDSEEVKAYRKIASKKKTLDDIVTSKEFENFCRTYNRTIRIRYKTGAIRGVLFGSGISMRLNQQAKAR